MPEPLDSLNLNLLRSLAALIATRNLSRAAENLGITQSGVSRQLAELRRHFGDPLLVREGQRYVLTARAQALADPLQAVLEQVGALLKPVDFDPATCRRRFSLAASDYVAEHVLPGLATRLLRAAPGAGVEYRLWTSGRYEWLADGEVDVVSTITDRVPANLHGQSLGRDGPVCVMRAGHPLAGAGRLQALSADDYLGFGHARVVSGGDKDSSVDRALAALGRERRIAFGAPSFAAVLQVVSDTDLLATLPEHIAANLAERYRLTWRPLPFGLPPYDYWNLWHARDHHDPAHRWFREQLIGVVQASLFGVAKYLQSGGRPV